MKIVPVRLAQVPNGKKFMFDPPKVSAGLSSHNRSILQLAVVGDAHLPTDDNSHSQNTAPGDAGLGSHDRILANPHVVRDLHQIIDLDAHSHVRPIERASINR